MNAPDLSEDVRRLRFDSTREGDTLITSGLGGRFPPDYPVAIVTNVERIPGETFALVQAQPLALLDQTREVLLVWTASVEAEQEAEQETDQEPAETVGTRRGKRSAE